MVTTNWAVQICNLRDAIKSLSLSLFTVIIHNIIYCNNYKYILLLVVVLINALTVSMMHVGGLAVVFAFSSMIFAK